MKNLAYRLLTCSLALLLAINTAAAGRWFRSCWDAPACGPMPACCPVETCCEPVVVECGGCDDCGSVEVVEMSSDCGCDGEVVSETVMHESIGTPTEAIHPPQPTEVEEPAPAAFGGGFRSDTPVAADPAPSNDWNAGFEEPVAEPIPAEEPAEELFAEPAPMEEPADDLFAEPAPAPAEPIAAEPIEEPADDLFADEPMEEEGGLFDEPAEEPMQEEDDLFGAPAEEVTEEPADDLFADPAPAEEPADDLFGEPAEEPMEDEGDLFGEPAAEEPADDLFGEPAEEPMEDEGDLFGEPAAEEPAEDLFGEPAAEEPADDLFGEPAAEEPADDLFGAEEEPMEDDGGLFDEPAEAVEDAADDLFGPDDAEPADAEDDLFGGFGAILREPGGVDSVAARTWVDNTGRFSTVGRLLAIDGGTIRLAKENGAIATVPLSRLSQADLEFVSRQSVAMHQAQEHAIAQGSEELPLRTAQL